MRGMREKRLPVIGSSLRFSLLFILGMVFTSFATVTPLPPRLTDNEEPIVFPDDSGVVDVTKPPYNAKGDGRSDDSDAIQRAFDDHPSQNRIIYFPDGIYLVSHQIEFGLSRRFHPDKKIDGRDALHQRLTILQGQSRDKTIIKLADNCPEFQTTGISEPEKDVGRPIGRGVVWTGENVAQHFRNAVRNITIDTGKGNPGASGIQFNASNQGCMHQVKIVSGDGAGAIGCDLGFTGDAGPAVVRHLEVVGFDYGVWVCALNSFTVWDVQLQGQKKAGIRCPWDMAMLHRVHSVNTMPALWIGNRWLSFTTLIDGELLGGAPDQPAIRIDGGNKDHHFFGRNIKSTGYGWTVKSSTDASLNARGNIEEYSYGPVTKAFPDCVPKTLNLPVKEAPEVPWGDPKRDWANVVRFGAKMDGSDCTEAVQRAIDSGARVVYFPGGEVQRTWGRTGVEYRMKKIALRGHVQRFLACEAYVNAERIDVEDGIAPAVVIERFMPSWEHGVMEINQKSSRSLILRYINGLVHQEARGDVFLDDVCGGLYLRHPGASAWCRYFNYEVSPGLGLVNDGGNLWIMGSKIEHPNPQVELLNGSHTEILGAMWYAGFGDVVEKPGMRIVDSAASIVCHRQHSFGPGRWKNWIEIERRGEKFLWTNWALDFLATAAPTDLDEVGRLRQP